MDYFEAERERRRSQFHAMGHPDSWEQPPLKRQKTNEAAHGRRVTSKLSIVGDVPADSKAPVAFTDTLAGNPNKREAGQSMLSGIKRGRHVASKFFRNALRGEQQEDESIKRQRIASSPTPKKTRRGCRGGRARRINKT